MSADELPSPAPTREQNEASTFRVFRVVNPLGAAECQFTLRGSAGWDIEYVAVLKPDGYHHLKDLQRYGEAVTQDIVDKVIERVVRWRTWERDPTWHHTDLTPDAIKQAREAPETVQAWRPNKAGRLMTFEDD